MGKRDSKVRLKQLLHVVFVALMILTASSSFAQISPGHEWRRVVADRLPLYGHRNWIVIADSAYPAQTRPGIETIVTNADQIQVTKAVLDLLDHARHVTPTVFTDAELQYVPEKDAPGIEAYRKQLS